MGGSCLMWYKAGQGYVKAWQSALASLPETLVVPFSLRHTPSVNTLELVRYMPVDVLLR
jgi:hypothetical protein